ncbi:MAG TPA: ABC transporter permease [Bryobacteraceae bacterium]|nr:ABC transporter permease [Bryobacteraceae bacterium]
MNWWERFRSLFCRTQLDADLDEEIRSHIALSTEDYLERGLARDEARRQALLKFGAIESSKDAHRDARGIVWLDGLWCDLRFALRSLRRDRVFAIAAIVMLSLAMGLNQTAFRVMDATLLHGYRMVRDNDRVLYITEKLPGAGCCVSYFDFEHWRDQAHAFQELAFMAPRSITLAQGDGDARTMWASAYSSGIFHLFGVAPILGRVFERPDTVPGSPPVVIVSYAYWQAWLGGRSDVIGQTVRMNGQPATVIGVMPAAFDLMRDEVWLPLIDTPLLHNRVPNGGEVFGRLAPGATEAQARAELEAINQRLANEYPGSNRGVLPDVRNFRDSHGVEAALLYSSLWAGAWFVLWIACANIANLALARAEAKSRELSTRMALGAGRGRILRQLFLENLLVALAAGTVAWLLSAAGVQLWVAATRNRYSAPFDYTANAGTSIYLIAIALVSAILITLAPIARLRHVDVNGVLKGASRGSTLTLRAKHISAVLIAGQMGLAVILIAVAGVLGRSLWNVLSADVGVRSPERVLTGHITLPRERYRTPESRFAFFEAFQTRIRALPGAEAAALGDARPVDSYEPQAIEVNGHPGSRYVTPIFATGPGYFDAIGSAILAGRDFVSADRLRAPAVALVNQRFADVRFPGEDPIGRQIRLYEKYHVEPSEWRTIVGVVSNVMQNEETRQQFLPVVYLPLAQQPAESAWFFLRTQNVSPSLTAGIREQLRELDPKLEINEYSTLQAALDSPSMLGFGRMQDLSRDAVIAPIYAALALLLAAVGLYAVVRRSVGQRTREIGVRIALGAAPRQIQRLVFTGALMPVFVGLAIGLAGSFAVNRILQFQLVAVSPYDALTLTIAPIVLIAVAILGCAGPVREALRIDPAGALRHD